MKDEEWAYHRDRAIQLHPLGLCSRMRNGLIKIEGEAPMTENQVLNWLAVQKFDPHTFHSLMEKLRALT